jgi:dynein heavy chain, axonemal
VLTDAEIKSETFLEAINSMLATGEIPGLLGKEERELYPTTVRAIWQKEEKTKADPTAAQMWLYFLSRVKDNLHTVLAFSPIGNKFRERAQKFPSLFSQCSIDWFLQWPLEALVDVSKKIIGEFQITCTKEVKAELIQHMGQVHNMVTDVCELYFGQFRRRVYVTPKSYLSFLNFYKNLYTLKLRGIEVEEKQIVDGLDKLAEASEGVSKLKKELAVKEEQLKKS